MTLQENQDLAQLIRVLETLTSPDNKERNDAEVLDMHFIIVREFYSTYSLFTEFGISTFSNNANINLTACQCKRVIKSCD